jgi:hypothetical protein
MGQGKQFEGGVLKSLGERSFWVFSFCVIFFGKGRRGMRSLSRWWEGESGLDVWGYFKE